MKVRHIVCRHQKREEIKNRHCIRSNDGCIVRWQRLAFRSSLRASGGLFPALGTLGVSTPRLPGPLGPLLMHERLYIVNVICQSIFQNYILFIAICIAKVFYYAKQVWCKSILGVFYHIFRNVGIKSLCYAAGYAS